MSSGAVDTKTVEMRFDNSNFEKNAKQSMSTLEKLKRALKLDGASAGLRDVERASKKLDFRDFKNSISDVGKKFSILEEIAIGALRRIGGNAAEAGLKLAKSLSIDQVAAGWNKYDQKTTAVQTIMANLRDTQNQFISDAQKMEYVNAYLDKLMWFSDETSYSFTEMTDNVGKFIANGQGLEDSVTAMQGIATWAAISGQRSQSAARAMYNISQAMGVGAMKTIDWKSIENANMATAEFKETAINAAIAMNKLKKGQVTIETFRESLQKGWFDKDVMMEVFRTYGEAANKIQEYSKATGKTATEIIRDIRKGNKEVSDEVGVTADSLGFRALSAAQEAKTFSEVMEATSDAVSTKWLRVFETIFGNYLEAKEMWTDVSEQLWEVFAEPLDNLNTIMDKWKKGFHSGGPMSSLDEMLASGKMDDLKSGVAFVTKSAAEAAVATDSARYSIVQLEDGTKSLVETTKDSSGKVTKSYRQIYYATDKFISGRSALLEGFQNIFDTLIHDVVDDKGKLESMSFFGSLKRGLQEVLFGTSELDELLPKMSEKLWDLTIKFKDFTERLKPSMETSLKLKNAFKGLFTLFKIGGKFVKAIIKPFKDFFRDVLGKKEGEKGLLDLADSMGTWIQKLEQFLDENKTFEAVSNGIRSGLDWIREGINNLFTAVTGKSASDFFSDVKTKIFAFFENYDFKGTFSRVGDFFRSIINQIKQVKTGDLPEKLTPLQNFWIFFKNIYEAAKKIVKSIAPFFATVGEFINGFVSSISKSLSSKKIEKKESRFSKIFDGIKEVFRGFGNFFEKISPTIQKAGKWVGDFLTNFGDRFAKFTEGKSFPEIIDSIVKGGFFVSLTRFFSSLAKLKIKNTFNFINISGGLSALREALVAYKREINASTMLLIAGSIAVLAGAMWLIAKIDSDKLIAAGIAMGGVAGVIVGISYALANLISVIQQGRIGANGKGGVLDSLRYLMRDTIKSSIFGNDATAKFVKICTGLMFAAIAAVLVVVAVKKAGEAIQKLAKIPDVEVKKGGLIFGQIMLVLGAFSLLAGFSRTSTGVLFAAIGAYVLVRAIIKLVDYIADLGRSSNKIRAIETVGKRFKDVFVTLKKVVFWILKIFGAIAAVQAIVEFIAVSAGDAGTVLGMANVLKQFGKNFIRIAFSLIFVAAAFALMTVVSKNMDPKTVEQIKGIFGLFLIVVGVVTSIAALIASKSLITPAQAKVFEYFGKTFTFIGASLLLLALAFGIMTQAMQHVNTKQAIVIGVVLLGFVALVGTLLEGIAALVGWSKNPSGQALAFGIFGVAFVGIALSLLGLVWAFKMMAEAMKKVSTDDFNDIVNLFGIFIGVIGTMLVIIAALTGWSKNTVAQAVAIGVFGVSFAAIAASLVILAAAFGMMADTVKNVSDNQFNDIVRVFAIFIALAGIFLEGIAALVGWSKNPVMQTIAVGVFSLAIVGMAYSLVIVANAFGKMADAMQKVTPDQIDTIIEVLGGFLGIAGLLAFVGAIAGSSLAGAIGIAVMAGFMLVAAKSLGIVAEAFAKLGNALTPEKVENIANLLTAIKEAITGFSGLDLAVLIVLSVVVLPALAIACLLIGVAIAVAVAAFALFNESFTKLIETVIEYGPKFVQTLIDMGDSILDGIIKLAPKAYVAIVMLIGLIVQLAPYFAKAAAVLILSLAQGIAESSGALAAAVAMLPIQMALSFFNSLGETLPYVVYGIVIAINALADTIRSQAGDMAQAGANLIEALMEAIILAVIKLGTWIPGIGDEISGLVEEKLFPKMRKAFHIEPEIEYTDEMKAFDAGEEGAGLAAAETGKADAKEYSKAFTEEIESGGLLDDLKNKYPGLLGDMTGLGSGESMGEGFMSMISSFMSADGKLPGLEGGTLDVTKMLGITDFDLSSLTGGIGDAFGEMDFSQYGVANMDQYAQGVDTSKETTVKESTEETAKSIEETYTGLDSYTWGYDLSSNQAKGIDDGKPLIEASCISVASMIKSILGFSEPETGPLSDFHTYAPDMIKLWCKGVNSNLGLVESSTNEVANTVYDGFSTALDYVSDLIDNGMSDQLTIRPVMDLSEIQNGLDSMNGMMSNANGYEITGTTRLAASTAYGMRGTTEVVPADTQTVQADVGPTNNTFYITNGDPDAVAQRVSKILSQQTRRQKAVFAK